MSVWTDMQKRSTGELTRREDSKYIKFRQWIDEIQSSFPESEFRKLYTQNPLPIVDYISNLKPDKNYKPFKPIEVKWNYKFKPSKDFWK